MVTYPEEIFEAAKQISSVVAAVDKYVVDPTEETYKAAVAKAESLPAALEEYSQAVEKAQVEV